MQLHHESLGAPRGPTHFPPLNLRQPTMQVTKSQIKINGMIYQAKALNSTLDAGATNNTQIKNRLTLPLCPPTDEEVEIDNSNIH